MGAKANRGIQIGAEELVLKAPQHYHVEVYCYESLNRDNGNFEYSTAFHLVGNDLELIKSRAKQLADTNQRHVYVKEIKQCGDSSHVEGTQ